MAPQHRSHPGQGSGQPRYPGSFLLALKEALARMNWQVRRWLGGAVECVDDQGREHVVGLENFYRRLRREDRATWPELLFQFLSSVPTEQLSQAPAELASVAERLLVRLGAPFGPRSAEGVVWFRLVADSNLAANLVLDYPQSMSYVTEQMVADSGRTGQEWLVQALANLLAQTPANWLKELHAESGLCQSIVGDAYDSSRALILDQLVPDQAGLGHFVAVPGRDELVVLPVRRATLPHLPLLKVLAAEEYKKAPYAISNEVFWVYQGKWRLFPIHLRGEEITVDPPLEFVEIFQRLQAEEQGEEGK